MFKPSYYCYYNYSSENYGLNALCFRDTNGNLFYYSYDELVAFEINGEKHVLKNYWGSTTGKHLNAIDGGNKADRETKEEFEKNLERLGGGK